MSFTAYAQLRLPQMAAAYAHLRFPVYFRIELSWAKLAGVTALLVSAPGRPPRRRRWGRGVGLAVETGVLWDVSYFFLRRL